MNNIEHPKRNAFFEILKWSAIFLILVGVSIAIFFLFEIKNQGVIRGEIYDPNTTSSIGNFVGGIVGTVWALAGVIFLFATLVYQRSEFEKTRELLELQSRISYKQQFEGSFFKLLDLFIRIQQNDKYDEASTELRQKYDGEEKSTKGDKKVAYLKLKSLFEKRHKNLRSSFESFASIIKSIYSFIGDSEINNSSFYSEILKSHLFRKDSLFLFVYTLYKEDEELGKILIEYDVLGRLFDQKKYYEVVIKELFPSPTREELLTLI